MKLSLLTLSLVARGLGGLVISAGFLTADCPKYSSMDWLVGQNCCGRLRTVWNDVILFDIHILNLNRTPVMLWTSLSGGNWPASHVPDAYWLSTRCNNNYYYYNKTHVSKYELTCFASLLSCPWCCTFTSCQNRRYCAWGCVVQEMLLTSSAAFHYIVIIPTWL